MVGDNLKYDPTFEKSYRNVSFDRIPTGNRKSRNLHKPYSNLWT